MVSNVLYYPHIQVPETAWCTRVLLYWDRVGSIVPSQYIDNPEGVGDYMRALVRENLVVQVIPGYHLWRVNNFTKSFVNFIDTNHGHRMAVRRPGWALLNRDKLGGSGHRRLHREKFGGTSVHMEKLHTLAEELKSRGLAADDETNPGSWLVVEPHVARDFMAYLASVLGQLPGEETFIPITDQRKYLSPFLSKESAEADYANVRHEVRTILLSQILPAPTTPLQPAQIRDFKERYSKELVRFRTELENCCGEIAAIADPRLRKIRAKESAEHLRAGREEIASRMKEQKRWPRIGLSAFCAIGGPTLAGWQAIQHHDPRLAIGGAFLSLTAAVCDAFRNSRMDLRDKPLAYAALAQRRLTS